MALTELIGQTSGPVTVDIERGPVRNLAEALLDDDPTYLLGGPGSPVPPTFPFVMTHWGTVGDRREMGIPTAKLRGEGRAILHGNQEFVYERMPRIGDRLVGTTTITDVSEKERANGGKMEFYVAETQWRDEETGDLVVTSIFTMIVNVRPPQG